MSRNMLVLFLFVAVVCATVMSYEQPIKKCPKNEIWSKCDADCQPTCKNQKPPPPKHHKKCVPGCVCAKGLVRNAKNECVRPCECDC